MKKRDCASSSRGFASVKLACGGIVRAPRAPSTLITEATPAAHPVCPMFAFTLPSATGAPLPRSSLAAALTSTPSPTGVAVACASRN